MKVWLFDPYGPLPGEEWREHRFTMILKALVERGHTVTWWTAGFDHFTKRTRAKDWTPVAVSEGGTVRLVPTPTYRRNISLARLWFEFVFAWRVFRKARKEEGPAIIVAADPPQANGVAAVLLSRHFRVPLILDCLDLWPEIFDRVLSGPVRIIARPFLALLARVRSWTYSRAAAAVASCDTYRQRLLETVPGLRTDQISTVFLGISVSDVAPHASNRPMPGIAEKRPGEFRVIYAGTLATNYDIATVLDTARLLLANERIRFVIAGDGPLRDFVTARIESEALHNTTYLGRIPVADLGDLYAEGDVGLIPYASWSTVAMPIKLFDYVAAGLPIVSSIMGELSHLMTDYEFGLSYESGDARSLAAAIESIFKDAPLRTRMAENSRLIARRFDRNEQYGQFADIVERVAAGHPASPGR